MASNASWPRGGQLISYPSSAQEELFLWIVGDFLRCHKESGESGSGKKRVSFDFSFAGATWTLFLYFDPEYSRCRLDIHVRSHTVSEAQSDCQGVIEFLLCKRITIKKLECILRCGGAGSHFKVVDFLSDSEMGSFLREGWYIRCKLRLHPSASVKTAIDWTAFLGDWKRDDDSLERWHLSQWVTGARWKPWAWMDTSNPPRSLHNIEKKRSVDFSFGDATFTFLIAIDRYNMPPHTSLGIRFRTTVSSEEVYVCRCEIQTKTFQCQFRCERAESHWSVTDFLSHSELLDFLRKGQKLAWTISRELENKSEEISEISHVCKLGEDLKQLLLSGEESDATVRVQGQQFRVHRSILVARSPVFASMFRHDMKEKATGVVDIEDCEASAFPVLLEYLYCGSTERLSVDNVFGLYVSADKYDLQDLKSECVKFIGNNLSVETFCETLHLSIHQHSENNLMQLSIDFFAKNMNEIIKTAKWQDFLLHNPMQANAILIEALKSGERDK